MSRTMASPPTVEQYLTRFGGHPWDGMRRPGFDLLEIQSTDKAACDRFVKMAERKFWNIWLIGATEDGKYFGGLLYKPSGIDHSWEDSPQNPHPGCVSVEQH